MAGATFTAASIALNVVPDMSGFFSDIDARIRGYDPPVIRPRVDPDVDMPDVPPPDTSEAESTITNNLKAAAAVAAVAVGAIIGQGIADGLETANIRGLLGAQLGDPAVAEQAGKVAGGLFRAGWSDSVGDAGDVVQSAIKQGLLDPATQSVEDMTAIMSRFAIVAQGGGAETGEVLRAVGAMVKNGLAPDVRTAQDIIAKGFQSNADVSGEFLEVITEYGPNFAQLGLSGQQAVGLITQALDNGAFSADQVGDAFREFGIKMLDGSADADGAITGLGLNFGRLQADIAGGGPKAAAAFDTILTKIRETEDPLARNTAGAAVFGSMWEDSGGKVAAMDLGTALVGMENLTTAVDDQGVALDTPTAKFQSMANTLRDNVATAIADHVLPALTPLLDTLVKFVNTPGVPEVLLWVLGAGAAVAGIMVAITVAQWAWTVAVGAWSVAAGIASAATWAFNAALAVLGAPILIIIGVIALLVGALVWAWFNVDWFREGVITAVTAVGDFFVWIFDEIIKPAFDGFTEFLEGIVPGLAVIWDGIKKVFGTPVYFVLETVWNNGIGGLWQGAKNLGIPLGDFPKADTSGIAHFAGGGRVAGTSPTKTADDQLIWATAGEYMQPVDSVDYYGLDVMERIRRREMSREGLAHLAYGGVVPHVAAAGDEITSNFGVMPGGIGGVGYRANKSDHPIGLALDFMTLRDMQLGDRVAGHLSQNANRLAVKYLIWRQRINEGGGWKKMADRGSVTANHFDHVHASFQRMMGVGPGGFSGINEGFSFADMLKPVFDAGVTAVRGLVEGAGFGRKGNFIGDLPMGMLDWAAKNVGDFLFSRAREEDATRSYTGASVDQWIPVVKQALDMLGLSHEHYLGPLLDRMERESGGNPRAINLDDVNAQRGDPSIGLMQVIGCVPLSTKILTRRGWLRHDEVRVGDKTLGYNPETGRSEWTHVTRVHHYSDRTVRRIGNGSWHADVTEEHRWWSDTKRRVPTKGDTWCSDCRREFPSERGRQVHVAKMHGQARGPEVRDQHQYIGEFVRTADLRNSHRIRVAAPADTDGIPGLSARDVRVIAWMQGDGHISKVYAKPVVCPECGWLPGTGRKPGRGPLRQPATSVAVHRQKIHDIGKDVAVADGDGGWDGFIYQSKPQMVTKLRALLADVPHTVGIRQRQEHHHPAYEFRLTRAYVTDLMKRSDLPDLGDEAFVLALSPDQRAAWLDAMIDAEGNRQADPDHPEWRDSVRIAQNDGPLQDAIRLAVYLEGWRPSVRVVKRAEERYAPAGIVGMHLPHVAPSMLNEPVDLGVQDVWCVETKLGTWTMEQDSQVMLTGNSTFKRFWDPRTPNDIYNPLSNIVASLRYAEQRYGDAVIGYTKPGGYDQGGELPPGLGMYRNSLTHSETVIPLPPDLVNNLVSAGTRSGPLIGSATITHPVDIDLVAQRLDFLTSAGGL